MLGVTLLSRMESGEIDRETRASWNSTAHPPCCVTLRTRSNLIKLTYSNMSCAKLYITNNCERAVSVHGATEVMFRA